MIVGTTSSEIISPHQSFKTCLKCSDRLHLGELLLEGDLAGHVPDEVLRDAELGGDVLGGDQAPGHRQLDVGPDVGRALARRAVNLPAGLDMRKC